MITVTGVFKKMHKRNEEARMKKRQPAQTSTGRYDRMRVPLDLRQMQGAGHGEMVLPFCF